MTDYDFADPNRVICEKLGYTSLHRAVANNAPVGVLRTLLAAGADTNKVDAHSQTSLHLAITASLGVRKVRLLLEAGALPNKRDDNGRTPLYRAVKPGGKVEVVRALLEAGADPNTVTNYSNSPVNTAIDYLLHQQLEVLLDHGGIVKDHAWAMHQALHGLFCHKRRMETAAVLLQHGVKPGRVLATLRSPSYAFEKVKFLLQAGADPNAVDDGFTPLIIFGYNPQLVSLLIAHGANPNIIVSRYRTAYNTAKAPMKEWYDRNYGARALVPANRHKIDTRSRGEIKEDLEWIYLMDRRTRRRNTNRPIHLHRLPEELFIKVREWLGK